MVVVACMWGVRPAPAGALMPALSSGARERRVTAGELRAWHGGGGEPRSELRRAREERADGKVRVQQRCASLGAQVRVR